MTFHHDEKLQICKYRNSPWNSSPPPPLYTLNLDSTFPKNHNLSQIFLLWEGSLPSIAGSNHDKL